MLMIGWTTVETQEQADALARDLVDHRLAACVQIEGPLVSHYHWKGKHERTPEFRLCVKFLSERQPELANWILTHHPYENPEWTTVLAENVSEKYLSWVKTNTYN